MDPTLKERAETKRKVAGRQLPLISLKVLDATDAILADCQTSLIKA